MAYSLGRALVAVFQTKLAEAAAIADPDARTARRRELDTNYRAEATALLRQGAALPGEIPIEVPLALAERRYEDALRALPEDSGQLRWPFEGIALRGAVMTAQADARRDLGQFDDARASIRQAESVLRGALTLAPSYPEAHRALCRLRGGRLALDAAQGGGIDASFREAEAAATAYLEVEPGEAAPWLERGRIRLIQGQACFDLYRNQETDRLVGQTLDDADVASRRAPESAAPRRLRAAAYRLASFRRVPVLGLGTGELAARAEAELAAVSRREPLSAADFHTLGAAWRNHADNLSFYALFERASTTAPASPDSPAARYRQAFHKAMAALQQAVRLDPAFGPAHKDIAYLQLKNGVKDLEEGRDPEASFRRCIESSRRALAINPGDTDALDNLSNGYRCLADWEMETGRDPRPDFRRAEAAFLQNIQANPQRVLPYDQLIVAYRAWTRHELRTGGSPEAILRLQQALVSSLPWDREDPARFVDIGMIEIFALEQAAAVRTVLGGDTQTPLSQAMRVHRRMERTPFIAKGWGGRLRDLRDRLDLAAARVAVRKGKSPAPALGGLLGRHAGVPLATFPDSTLYFLAEARLLLTEWHAGQGRPPGVDAAAGLALLEEAMSGRPAVARLYSWSDSLMLRGRFRLALARGERDPARVRAEAALAEADFLEACRRNRFQERVTAPLLEAARQVMQAAR